MDPTDRAIKGFYCISIQENAFESVVCEKAAFCLSLNVLTHRSL